ncbi:MAG: hypothetical protein IKQ35_02050 [Bacilli bacterium]|nr:hypothetical protein [Bacilli bacterium]
MDKIAIISGVYGDLNALRSVLVDINIRGINTIYCLGNIISNESKDNSRCLELIKNLCTVSLMGDKEEGIGLIEDAEQYSISDIDYLRGLPFSHQFLVSGRTVRLFNDNPYNSFNKKNYDNKKIDLFKPSVRTENGFADVVVCGRNNGAFEEVAGCGHVIGVQDVSDGDFANYIIIEGNMNSRRFAPISYQHVQVPKTLVYPVSYRDQQSVGVCKSRGANYGA